MTIQFNDSPKTPEIKNRSRQYLEQKFEGKELAFTEIDLRDAFHAGANVGYDQALQDLIKTPLDLILQAVEVRIASNNGIQGKELRPGVDNPEDLAGVISHHGFRIVSCLQKLDSEELRWMAGIVEMCQRLVHPDELDKTVITGLQKDLQGSLMAILPAAELAQAESFNRKEASPGLEPENIQAANRRLDLDPLQRLMESLPHSMYDDFFNVLDCLTVVAEYSNRRAADAARTMGELIGRYLTLGLTHEFEHGLAMSDRQTEREDRRRGGRGERRPVMERLLDRDRSRDSSPRLASMSSNGQLRLVIDYAIRQAYLAGAGHPADYADLGLFRGHVAYARILYAAWADLDVISSSHFDTTRLKNFKGGQYYPEDYLNSVLSNECDYTEGDWAAIVLEVASETEMVQRRYSRLEQPGYGGFFDRGWTGGQLRRYYQNDLMMDPNDHTFSTRMERDPNFSATPKVTEVQYNLSHVVRIKEALHRMHERVQSGSVKTYDENLERHGKLHIRFQLEDGVEASLTLTPA